MTPSEFAATVEDHYAALVKFAKRKRVKDQDAADVVNAALVDAYKKRESFARRSTPLTWLTGFVVNHVKRYFDSVLVPEGAVAPAVRCPWCDAAEGVPPFTCSKCGTVIAKLPRPRRTRPLTDADVARAGRRRDVVGAASRPEAIPAARVDFEKALDRIEDPDARAAIVQVRLLGYSHEEAAKRIGLPPSTVHSILARDLPRFLATLKEMGYECPDR